MPRQASNSSKVRWKPSFFRDRVARREAVAGVEADPEARAEGRTLDDRLQVLEAVPQVGPLAGGVLQEDLAGELRHLQEQQVEGLADPLEADLLPMSRCGSPDA